MRIDINDETRDVPAGMTVLALLEDLGRRPMGTVVERNGAIVDRDAFASHPRLRRAIGSKWCDLSEAAEMTHAERMARFTAADLYVVITEAFCGGGSAIDVLDAVLDAGVQLVQFREKQGEDRELYHRAEAFRQRTAGGSVLLINDRVDIALAACADGVHLGQGDLPLGAARASRQI